MRTLYKPKVYLVGETAIVEEGLQAFLDDNDLKWPTPTEGVPDPARLIEGCGRLCYMSFGSKVGSKTNESYIANLVDHEGKRSGPAHGSVCEHPHWTFWITGAGRGFTHEQVRHRVGVAYSQLSTRYCDFERKGGEEGTWDPGFVVPPLAQLSERTRKSFEDWYKLTQEQYAKHVAFIEEDIRGEADMMAGLAKDFPSSRGQDRAVRKAARGAARGGLPIDIESIIAVTCNARSIWNMAYARANKHAEAPIRDIFVQIINTMEKRIPTLFNGWVYKKVWDRSLEAVPPRDKI